LEIARKAGLPIVYSGPGGRSIRGRNRAYFREKIETADRREKSIYLGPVISGQKVGLIEKHAGALLFPSRRDEPFRGCDEFDAMGWRTQSNASQRGLSKKNRLREKKRVFTLDAMGGAGADHL